MKLKSQALSTTCLPWHHGGQFTIANCNRILNLAAMALWPTLVPVVQKAMAKQLRGPPLGEQDADRRSRVQ